MPVVKFRSLAEARAAQLGGDAGRPLAERIARVLALSAALAPGAVTRGVTKFRSIDEANRHRAAREKERAAALRSRIVRGGATGAAGD